MKPLLLYIAVLGCPLPAAADTCNKNKHCEDDEFCNCDTNGGSCKNRLSQCQTCASVGQPSFATGTDTCDRYESACGYNCDGSDYPATAPAPTPRPQSAPTPQPQSAPTPQPQAAPAPTPRPTEGTSGGTGTGVSCSKNKHCEDGEFCNAEADECFACYYPGDLDPDSTACARYENGCGDYACDGSDWDRYPTFRPTPRPTPYPSSPRPTPYPSLRPTPRPTSYPSLRPTVAPIVCPFGDSLVLALPSVYDTAADDEFRFWAEFSFDTNITEATLDFMWRDQGFGNQKGKIMVEQSDHSGNLVASTTLDGFFPRSGVIWMTESITLPSESEWTDVLSLYRVGGGGGHRLEIKDATLTVNCGSTSAPTSTPAPTQVPTATPTPRPTLTLRPSVATEALSCDSITVSGTETSAMYWGSYDGLYETAGECHGQPYYKCTCCTDYDPDVVEMCAADPEGCADENGGAWDQSQCMADIGGGGVHHYVFYSSDDAAWYLKQYWGDGSGTDSGWDECGTVGDFGRGNEYRLADGNLARSAGLWELRTSYSWETDTWEARPDVSVDLSCAAVDGESAGGGRSGVFAFIDKLMADDKSSFDNFGGSVAIDGDTVVVGANGDGTYWSGSVYVYRTTDGGATYDLVVKLRASDAGSTDSFGISVAIDGGTIVVGAMNEGPGWVDGTYYQGYGAVYVFRTTDGWTTHTEIKLTAADVAEGDKFGRSVAIDGNTIVVGTFYGEAAYLFHTSDGGVTYGQVAKLTAADGAAGDSFGYSVAIDGDTIVIGTDTILIGTYYKEAAYVFRTSDGGATYGQVAKLDGSGGPVAIDGDTIVVGSNVFRTSDGGFTVVKAVSGTTCGEGDAAGRKVLAPSALAGTRCCGSIYDSFCNNDNDLCLNGAAPGYVTYEVAKATCEDAGARLCTPDELELSEDQGGVMGTGCNFNQAYVWSSEATYGQVAKLTASDAALGDYFGSSVAIAGGTIVVGARGYNDAYSFSGSAYVFRTTDGATYVEVAKLTAADAAKYDCFGASVAIDGGVVVIGANEDGNNGLAYNGWGSVYVFREEGSGGAAGAATASVGAVIGGVVAAAVAVVLGYLALIRFRSQSRASEQAAAADAEDIKLEAAFSDAADEMAAAEPSTGQKQAAP